MTRNRGTIRTSERARELARLRWLKEEQKTGQQKILEWLMENDPRGGPATEAKVEPPPVPEALEVNVTFLMDGLRLQAAEQLASHTQHNRQVEEKNSQLRTLKSTLAMQRVLGDQNSSGIKERIRYLESEIAKLEGR